MANDLVQQFRDASDQFGRLVHAVGSGDWDNPTPCSEWSVRDLVNHLVNEALWVLPLLSGETIESVGNRFDGDLLGDHPVAEWDNAQRQAVDAVASADLGRTVHLSYGDVAGTDYIGQLTADLVIHAWDLARGIGADDDLDPALVHTTYEMAQRDAEQLAQSGLFGTPVDVPDEADEQTKLLALVGRDRRESG